MTARNSANGSSSTDPIRSIPALLTSTSIGPISRSIRAIPSRTEASVSTSIGITVIGETLPRGGLRQRGGAGRVAHGGGHPVAGPPTGERRGQADAGAAPGDQDG